MFSKVRFSKQNVLLIGLILVGGALSVFVTLSHADPAPSFRALQYTAPAGVVPLNPIMNPNDFLLFVDVIGGRVCAVQDQIIPLNLLMCTSIPGGIPSGASVVALNPLGATWGATGGFTNNINRVFAIGTGVGSTRLCTATMASPSTVSCTDAF